MMLKILALTLALGVTVMAQQAASLGGVRGEVRTADGAPVPGAQVMVGSDTNSRFSARSTTDERGEFVVNDLPTGGIVLSVRGSGGRTVATVRAVVKAGEVITVSVRTR